MFSLALFASCHPENPQPTAESQQEDTGYDDYYYSAEYYESQQSEFVGEYAYFKGVIIDTSTSETITSGKVRTSQTTSDIDNLNDDGEYLLKTGRGDVVGYASLTLYQPDIILVDFIRQGMPDVELSFDSDTLVYGDTIVMNFEL